MRYAKIGNLRSCRTHENCIGLLLRSQTENQRNRYESFGGEERFLAPEATA
jgi:hypothetical protein